MDNRAGEMQVFLRVVEAGSFSEAARLLVMTPSTVSKLIGRIEARWRGLNPDLVRPSMYDVLVSGVPIRNAVHNLEIDLVGASIDLAAVAADARARDCVRRAPRAVRAGVQLRGVPPLFADRPGALPDR